MSVEVKPTNNPIANLQQAEANATAGLNQSSKSAVSGTMSHTEKMKMQMNQAKNTGYTENPNPTVMEQGAEYKPTTGTQQSTTQTQTSSTIIVGNDDGDDKKKGATKILIIVGIVIVFIILTVVVFSFMGGGSKVEEPEPTPPVEFIEPTPIPFAYTAEEIENLRNAGYTGDEIENAESVCVQASDLIAQAEERRAAWIEEAVAPLYDTASDEYKQQMSDTWMNLPVREDVDDFAKVASYYQVRKNLDYEKIEVHGNQFFIKIFLDDTVHESYFHALCTPEEWHALADYGNLIVTYTYATPLVGSDETGWNEDTTRFVITDYQLEIIK